MKRSESKDEFVCGSRFGSKPQVGVDSQCLSYLIDTISLIAEPTDSLATQKVALTRLYLYLPGTLWVTSTVTAECARIRNAARAELHASFISVLFGELPIRDFSAITARSEVLNQYHAGINDCIIVAEAEHVGHSVLLSFDSTLVRHLAPHSTCKLLEPAEYWRGLEIPQGSRPDKVPHATNPLSLETWWRF